MTLRAASWMVAAAALAGCGGGIVIGFGGFDDPPTVSLAAASERAVPGQPVRLVAAASDDDYVIEVAFYRVESDGSATFIGADTSAPYQWDAVMPALPRGSAAVFSARATDSAGQRSASATVAVLAD
jgi:hypothetical protein